MNTRKKYLIITIIFWTIVVLFMIIPIKESIYSYQNGANVALEGIEMVYGIEAISFILSLYIAFYFPLFIIWILLLFTSILLTIVTIIKYKKENLKILDKYMNKKIIICVIVIILVIGGIVFIASMIRKRLQMI